MTIPLFNTWRRQWIWLTVELAITCYESELANPPNCQLAGSGIDICTATELANMVSWQNLLTLSVSG